MSPIQQMLLGAGGSAVATKTYVDDIFSTFLYEGTGSAQSINNGIDLSGEGGMTWIKRRSGTSDHSITDTVRGAGNSLKSNENTANYSSNNFISAFNSNGFSIGTDADVGSDDETYASWTFRKAPGFFDVVTYTGNGSARTIAHSLGCIPGMVIVKCTSASHDWAVYHRSTKATHFLELNESNAAADNISRWNDTDPTSTHFSVGTSGSVNDNNATYVAYLFAGGESTASKAVSVNFNAGSDYLTTQSSSYGFGTGDFTIEFWTKLDTAIGTNATAAPGFFQLGTSASLQDDFKWMSVRARNDSGGRWQMLIKSTSTTNPTTYSAPDGDYPHPGQWYHVALVRNSSKTSLYINGELKIGAIDDTTNYNFDDMLIGSYYYNNYGLDGQISNFRIVGSAVYTSSFKPPTAPLTSITNTILLCCQSSTITAATTIPGTQTISSNGSPSANTSHPFDDPAGFVFGENEDQNVIKTGSYVGTGSAGIEVNIGWEPQLIIVKSTADGENWEIYDSMRGISDGAADKRLRLNSYDAEDDNPGFFSLRPNGFIVDGTSGSVNTDGDTYIYIAIRRPDGYVGKPADAGTDVFNTVDGDTDGVSPFFKNIGFPVDLALFKRKNDSSHNWGTSPRLTQGYYLSVNQTRTENSNVHQVFDYMSAWNSGTDTQGGYFSYAWKRHAGFDVVTWEGDDTNAFRRHNLGKTPEMIWYKNRDAARSWRVYHKGLNGGTNPEDYVVSINSSSAEGSNTSYMNGTAPTSTHFVAGLDGDTNVTGDSYIALLFASVEGISKVGSYTGATVTGTHSSGFEGYGPTIQLGFTPRFVMIKRVDSSGDWIVVDTVRGQSSNAGSQGPGNDKILKINSSDAQFDDDLTAFWSTSFSVISQDAQVNAVGGTYLYYALA